MLCVFLYKVFCLKSSHFTLESIKGLKFIHTSVTSPFNWLFYSEMRQIFVGYYIVTPSYCPSPYHVVHIVSHNSSAMKTGESPGLRKQHHARSIYCGSILMACTVMTHILRLKWSDLHMLVAGEIAVYWRCCIGSGCNATSHLINIFTA